MQQENLGQSISLWMATTAELNRSTLAEDTRADGEDVLIVGGEDHKTGQAPAHSDPYACLEAWTRQQFPMIREVRFR
jgi:hypothetical protein